MMAILKTLGKKKSKMTLAPHHEVERYPNPPVSRCFSQPSPFLPHLDQQSRFLVADHLEMIHEQLPKRLGLCDWTLIYSTYLHGMTLTTLYYKMQQYQGASVLVMQDTEGSIFGAFASEMIHQDPHFYGNGECFLFRLEPRRTVFPWSRLNDFFIYSSNEALAFGGGIQYALSPPAPPSCAQTTHFLFSFFFFLFFF